MTVELVLIVASEAEDGVVAHYIGCKILNGRCKEDRKTMVQLRVVMAWPNAEFLCCHIDATRRAESFRWEREKGRVS